MFKFRIYNNSFLVRQFIWPYRHPSRHWYWNWFPINIINTKTSRLTPFSDTIPSRNLQTVVELSSPSSNGETDCHKSVPTCRPSSLQLCWMIGTIHPPCCNSSTSGARPSLRTCNLALCILRLERIREGQRLPLYDFLRRTLCANNVETYF